MRSLLLKVAAICSRILPLLIRQSVYHLPIANLIRRALNWAASDGLSEVTVAAGALQDARLSLNLKSEKYYWLGNYEPILQKVISDLAKPGIVVYYVGAHVGYTALLFARAVGQSGKIFAFEPLPANIKRFQRNIAINGEGRVVRLIPMAASGEEGCTRFLVHSSTAMGKLKGVHGRNARYLGEINVPTVQLDDFVYRDLNPPPNVIKMDIEGVERGLFLAWNGFWRRFDQSVCSNCMAQKKDILFGQHYGSMDISYAGWNRATQRSAVRTNWHGKSILWHCLEDVHSFWMLGAGGA
jgi:FkbM family methyltransferase